MAPPNEAPSTPDGPTSPPLQGSPATRPQPDTNWLAGFAIGRAHSRGSHSAGVGELITVADAIAQAARLPTTSIVEHALDVVAQSAAISEDSRSETVSLLRHALELAVAHERGDG